MILHRLFRHLKPIRSKGVCNEISIASRLRNSLIIAVGNNNKILIGKDCIINDCVIALYGDNNVVIIEDTARLLGGATIRLDGHATLHIGKNVGVRKVDFLAKDAKIEIGELCMFSNNIIVRTHDSHKVLDCDSGIIINTPKDVILGRHVWIGQNVTILKGVNIGDNSILALGSVVTKSCSSNCIMAGSPAKIVKTGVTWDY